MKILKLILFVLLAAGAVSMVGAQNRRSQIEFYGGAAFPMSPDDFKDYAKVGLSGNAQYVIFPSPRLGVTFNAGYEFFSTDNAKFTDALSKELTGLTPQEWLDAGFNISPRPSAEIRSTLLRLGAGVRPYLTAPEAATQFFLLGQGSFNVINNDYKATNLPVSYDDLTGQLTVFSFDDKQFEELAQEDNDEQVFGVGVGAGFEMPAGSSFNLVVQGLFNILFTKDESTSFVGVTAGLVF
ncbi:MAG: hypothetical protein ONB48_03445 [candidate division KSB1 bacterium]|nr:hypothetical protein [candidate division KSB1 bacterium]MDZ7275606.1 hypothetical protein [candidate division KSB1 bacterium]MDZ7284703.1 hypothetical protein [candidate division KSB1 bacterium]MDZ7297878.1 hypothetical protein [candidate division KSB1 bacterium]MDZ7305994.1 hypothetical protein [candidate division KSB1 bacterium]